MPRGHVLEPDAVAAARRVAAACGYRSSAPVLVQESNNTVVWLRPHQVIAKVGKWRHSPAALAREHRVATKLAEVGAPIAPPLADARPTFDDATGFLVTLWNRLEHDHGRNADPSDLGRSLRDLHRAFKRVADDLPSFEAGIERARRVLGDDDAMSALPEDDRSFLRDAYDRFRDDAKQRPWREQPLHGEAHDGNVLITPAGLRWIDFEGACMGPPEWDLAFLPPAAATAFRDADAGLLATLRTLNSARVATWCFARWEFEELRWHGQHHLEQVRRASARRAS